MNELQCQVLIVELVHRRGGMAHKMAHRFLIGVVDLCIKPTPPYNKPVAFLEVKFRRLGANTPAEFEFNLDVTAPQKRFLTDYWKCGTPCGVVSFIERGNKGIKGLSVQTFKLDEIEGDGYTVNAGSHWDLSDPALRDATLWESLMKVYR